MSVQQVYRTADFVQRAAWLAVAGERAWGVIVRDPELSRTLGGLTGAYRWAEAVRATSATQPWAADDDGGIWGEVVLPPAEAADGPTAGPGRTEGAGDDPRGVVGGVRARKVRVLRGQVRLLSLAAGTPDATAKVMVYDQNAVLTLGGANETVNEVVALTPGEPAVALVSVEPTSGQAQTLLVPRGCFDDIKVIAERSAPQRDGRGGEDGGGGVKLRLADGACGAWLAAPHVLAQGIEHLGGSPEEAMQGLRPGGGADAGTGASISMKDRLRMYLVCGPMLEFLRRIAAAGRALWVFPA